MGELEVIERSTAPIAQESNVIELSAFFFGPGYIGPFRNLSLFLVSDHLRKSVRNAQAQSLLELSTSGKIFVIAKKANIRTSTSSN